MDALTYITAKADGKAAMILHGESTILVSLPGGFDPRTGEPLPNIDRGYQKADLVAMRENAADSVMAAQEALTKAQETLAVWDVVIADANAVIAAKK